MIQDTQNAQISLTHNGSKIYIYICNYENNVPSRFSQQRLCRNSYPCTCVVWLQGNVPEMFNQQYGSNVSAVCNGTSCVQVHELPIIHPPFILC